MATLIPDTSKKLYDETDVRPCAGLRPNDAYDLTLYKERGHATRGVLVVHTLLQLQFRDGKSTLPGTQGQKLCWTEPEKRTFGQQFKNSLYNAWNDKYRIATTSSVPAVQDIGVQFDIEIELDGWILNDHWELSVEKADDFRQSCVVPFTGNSLIDSHDVLPVVKRKGHRQRGAVHEFGHLLGLRDEYPAARDNTHWAADFASIMHSGETVRERHYAMFADWITEQYAHVAHLAQSPIVFKVNGRIDMSNAWL